MSDIVLTAYDFLPDNLQDPENNDLYPFLCPLIDHVLPPPKTTEEYPLDTLLARLGLTYSDDEAISAYYNKFIKPVIGTRPAMDMVFRLIGINADITEWWEAETPVPAFKFIITLNEYPGIVNFGALLDLIYALKNERSWPTTVRMAECADNLIWDYGQFDKEPMSASEGYLNELGVVICLYQYYKYYLPLEVPVSIETILTGQQGEHITFSQALRWDFDSFDDLWDEYWNAVQAQWSSITTYHTYAAMASETCLLWYQPINNETFRSFKIVDDDGNAILLDDGGELLYEGTQFIEQDNFCQVSQIEASPYHTGTYECQLVFSDYGTLSGGEGFLGSWKSAPTLMFDDNESPLDDQVPTEVPITQFVWKYHGVAYLDFSVLSSFASIGARYSEEDIATGVIIPIPSDKPLLLVVPTGRQATATVGSVSVLAKKNITVVPTGIPLSAQTTQPIYWDGSIVQEDLGWIIDGNGDYLIY